MNHKISELQKRYDLASKQSVYDRMKALDIKPINRGKISSESLDKLDKLNEFMKNNPGKAIWEFPKDTEILSSGQLDNFTGQLDKSSGQLDNFSEMLQLVKMITRHFKAETDPLAKYKALEYAAKHQFILPSSEIQELIGINPCKYGKMFQRGSFVFKKLGKIGRQAGWLIQQQ